MLSKKPNPVHKSKPKPLIPPPIALRCPGMALICCPQTGCLLGSVYGMKPGESVTAMCLADPTREIRFTAEKRGSHV